MDSLITYLKSKLNLNDFTLIKTTSNKLVIFKCFSKYTKCIYISVFDEFLEIKIDKIFDTKVFYPGIERLLISKKIFNNMDETLHYIQKNMIV
ncbi:MAG: hypothetical protein ACRC3Y_11365 [Romboutsia sp.]|uniref:hypothetical protein n=1 Tax=Romboutsia sp. TaxID=1965302 RepID=UPI003F2AAACB